MVGYSRGGRRSGSGSRLPSDDNTPTSASRQQSSQEKLMAWLRSQVTYLESKLFIILFIIVYNCLSIINRE